MQFSSSVPFQIYRNILCIYFLFSGISHFVFLSLKLTFLKEITFIQSWNYRISELFFKAKIWVLELTVTLFVGFHDFNW